MLRLKHFFPLFQKTKKASPGFSKKVHEELHGEVHS